MRLRSLLLALRRTDTAVLSHSRERRVSRITSLYLLGFGVVWLPSLVCRLQAAFAVDHEPAFALALVEAVCMPLQGALNALVYGWSLPSIRDVYRTMLLGTDGLNHIHIADERTSSGQYDSYSPSGASYTPPACAWPAIHAYAGGAYGCAPAACSNGCVNGCGGGAAAGAYHQQAAGFGSETSALSMGSALDESKR